jgi:hydrogen cyanide synthase HcnC
VWAGLRPGTSDELPVLGPVRGLDGYFNATGGFRTGIVASPLTGEVVAQWVSGERLSYPCEPFLMGRFGAAAPAPHHQM